MRRMVKASLVAITGIAAAGVVVPNAMARQDPGAAPSVAALAAAAADRVTATGVGDLAKGPDETLVRGDVVASGGLNYVPYQRTYHGLQVIGGDAVVVTDNHGRVLSVSSAMTGRMAMPALSGKVSAAAAAGTARSVAAGTAGDARQVVFVKDSAARLAWESLVEGRDDEGTPSRVHVYVDAATGKVLDSYDEVRLDTGRSFYNGTVTINVTPGRMVDPARPGLSCGPLSTRQPFTNNGTVWGNGSGTDLKTGCVDAFFAVEKEFDMLRTVLGRNGIDGRGRAFPLFVGLNQVNAFWDGRSGTFGHSQDNRRQATSIDVVAHEMGHGIFQFTPGGASGGNENGGINEGDSDIFASLTEAFVKGRTDRATYEVGEQVNLVGNGPIRFMYNPSLRGDPNCFSNRIPSTEVHSAAGPLNHWFYLVSEGNNPTTNGLPASPTCNNSRVTGISQRKAGQIWMGALNRKTSGWRYVNARVATLQSARQLFPTGCTEFNAVKAAWNAVSVPAQRGEPTCG